MQLANRSVVQPLGILEDVLVQVNELIFPTDFYVLDMEDETSGKGSTLILGRPFLMTARTKINVHAETLSMEFGDTLVQFNIFEAMKHPIEDHSLFGVNLIDELVEENFQLGSNSEEISNLVEDTELIDFLRPLTEEPEYDEMWETSVKADPPEHVQIETISAKEDKKQVRAESISANQGKNRVHPDPTLMQNKELKPILSRQKGVGHNTQRPRSCWHMVLNPTQVSQPDSKVSIDNSSSSLPPMELKPLLGHVKYAYLDAEQQLLVIIASNLRREHKDKLLSVLRQHKKEIRWKLSNHPRIDPSIYMHRILMEEESKLTR
ncbi:hypothetical protein CR513_28222, partial [Mucuna pruriens]